MSGYLVVGGTLTLRPDDPLPGRKTVTLAPVALGLETLADREDWASFDVAISPPETASRFTVRLWVSSHANPESAAQQLERLEALRWEKSGALPSRGWIGGDES